MPNTTTTTDSALDVVLRYLREGTGGRFTLLTRYYPGEGSRYRIVRVGPHSWHNPGEGTPIWSCEGLPAAEAMVDGFLAGWRAGRGVANE